MTIGSLFSGIGGLDLGLERAGHGPVLWQVEIDPLRRQWLANNSTYRRRAVIHSISAQTFTALNLQ